MNINEAVLTDAVTRVANAAAAKWGSAKKKNNLNSIIEHTRSQLRAEAAAAPEKLGSAVGLGRAATVYFCIYSELCAYNYFTSLPEEMWSNVAEETYSQLCSELSDSELGSLTSTPQKVKTRLVRAFVSAKRKYLGDDLMVKAYTLSYMIAEQNKKHFTDELNDRIMDKFLLAYDPKAPFTLEQALREYSKSSEKDLYKKDKQNAHESLDDMDHNTPYYAPYDSIEEDPASKLIRIIDMLRDCLIYPQRLGIKRIPLMYYKVFFTEELASMQETSDMIFDHLKRNLKLFSVPEALNIDFLNFYVDAECSVITDARHKPLKLMSLFVEDCDPDKRCTYPLEEIIFEKFLQKSKGSVSQMLKKYKEIRSNCSVSDI